MKTERTLVILKPDVLARGITGELITRFEKLGLKIVAMKMIEAQTDVAKEHYKKDDEWLLRKGKQISEQLNLIANSEEEMKRHAQEKIVNPLITDIQIYPVVCMILEGHKAVHMVKKMVGPTNPEDAQPGTIRGDYSIDSYWLANTNNRPVVNIIHCTDDPKEAEREINLWFKNDEVHDWINMDQTLLYRTGK